MALGGLHAEVTVGSELLCDGLPAASLGQLLAAAITAHLARLAIPAVAELLAGLCAAVGLCLVRAELVSRGQIEALRAQAAACSRRCRGPGTSSVRCLTASRRGVACHSLQRAVGGAAFTVGINLKGGCAWANRHGSRRLPMQRRRLPAPLLPLVAPCLHRRARCCSSLSDVDGGPCGGTGASSLLSRADLGNCAG